MKTYSVKPTDINQKWYVIDAEDQILGRLSTTIANVLRGKNKAIYSPHMDTGDYVVVINADKIKLTGNKLEDKTYYHHTGYIGGLKSISAKELLSKYPDRLITNSVSGMLPKNKLRKQFLKKLKVVAGPDHPYQAQKPEPLKA